ncbi:MAG: glycosyltransferase, partial [Proteiniphilum sp.]
MDQGKQVEQPKVSVIIPVYNTDAYVEEAVRSIMNQTLRDIEIILIDDGSTDNSLSVIEKLAREDSRIQYISQTNQGQSVARNAGLEKASGEYIYFMDSDDILDADAFQLCYDKCRREQLDFVLFHAVIFNPNHGFGISFDYKQPILDEREIYTGQSMLSEMISQRTYRCSPCIHFIRFKSLTLFSLRFFPGIIHEDELFTAQLYIQAQRAGYINQSFFKRRIRANSVMTMQFSMKNIHSYFVVTEQLLRYVKHSSTQTKRLIYKLIAYI